MKQRFYIILGVFVLILIIGVAALASQTPVSAKSKTAGLVEIYIYKNIGIDRIYYNNLDNPGESRVLTITDLPYACNASASDMIEFQVVTKEGYDWNTWEFVPVGRCNSDNPLLITASDPLYCLNNELNMVPTVVILRVSPSSTPQPTPTPTPFITPTPTPIE